MAPTASLTTTLAPPALALVIDKLLPDMPVVMTDVLLDVAEYGPVPPPTTNVVVVAGLTTMELGEVENSAVPCCGVAGLGTVTVTVETAPAASRTTILAVPADLPVIVMLVPDKATVVTVWSLDAAVYGSAPPAIEYDDDTPTGATTVVGAVVKNGTATLPVEIEALIVDMAPVASLTTILALPALTPAIDKLVPLTAAVAIVPLLDVAV